MKETRITLPELALVAATRVALGAGVGLLLSDRLHLDQRKAVGWTLFLVGLTSTVPLAFEILAGRISAADEHSIDASGPMERLGSANLSKRENYFVAPGRP